MYRLVHSARPQAPRPSFGFRASAQYAPGRALHAGIGWFTTAGIALSICARSSTCRPLSFAPPASCAHSETASVFIPAAYDISDAHGRAWNARSHRCNSRCLALRTGYVSVRRRGRKSTRTDGERRLRADRVHVLAELVPVHVELPGVRQPHSILSTHGPAHLRAEVRGRSRVRDRDCERVVDASGDGERELCPAGDILFSAPCMERTSARTHR
jgi:hypothetical protein